MCPNFFCNRRRQAFFPPYHIEQCTRHTMGVFITNNITYTPLSTASKPHHTITSSHSQLISNHLSPLLALAAQQLCSFHSLTQSKNGHRMIRPCSFSLIFVYLLTHLHIPPLSIQQTPSKYIHQASWLRQVSL